MRKAYGALASFFLITSAASAEPDPPVPPGRDLGGIPVGIICGGLDYTPDAIATRLARDGEGEIVGYDYIDDDRRPFARGNHAAQDMADIVLGEGQTTRIVLLRAQTDDMLSLSRALLYAGKSPAPIILIDNTPRQRDAITALASATRYFYDRLFVIAAGDEDRDLDQDWAAQLRGLPNLLIVSASDAEGQPRPGSNTGAMTVDIATLAAPLKGDGSRPDETMGLSMRAAAHIAALAARLKAVEPAIPAAAMKVRVSELAKPTAKPNGAKTIYGTIERPQRYFWQE